MDHNIVELGQDILDFESIVDEIDFLVPKYLDSLEELQEVDSFAEMPARIQNIIVYWQRLEKLFIQLEPLEKTIEFRDIMTNSLQAELAALEKVYLRVNLRIEFNESQWTRSLWKAADAILKRMDLVLEELDFAEEHEDRLLIVELENKNKEKYQKWLMSNKILRD